MLSTQVNVAFKQVSVMVGWQFVDATVTLYEIPVIEKEEIQCKLKISNLEATKEAKTVSF